MGGKFGFVVWLWIMSLCCTMIGGIGAYKRLHISQAQMVLDDSLMSKTRKKILEQNLSRADQYAYSVPVIFTTDDGKKIPQSDARLSQQEAYDLLAGKTKSVYISSLNPNAVYDKEELPTFMGWLLAGGAFIAISMIATKLLKNEYGYD